MALFEKLVGGPGETDPKLPVHQFGIALRLWSMGLVTRAQIVTEFELDPADDAPGFHQGQGRRHNAFDG